MQIIKEHIKQNQFKQCYLLYGTEEYLKKLYKNKLKTGIIGDEDTMNYTYFEGKSIEIPKVIEVAETLPFFSERRLILIQNSGLFKSTNDLADYIKTMPDYCYIVFVESEVDKRNRLYKAVKEGGHPENDRIMAFCAEIDAHLAEIEKLQADAKQSGQDISDAFDGGDKE